MLKSLWLEDNWKYAGKDWAGFDFISRCEKWKLEVKQSAAKQSWPGKASPGSFSIRQAKAFWEAGTGWKYFEVPTRLADLYVFAWHGLTGEDADHTNAEQWDFYVISSSALPNHQTISLKEVSKRASAVKLIEVSSIIQTIVKSE